jgi:DNA-binding response OmpR family regulator
MQEDQNIPPAPTGQTDQPAQTPQKKILVVEDEQFIGELYLRALTRAGYDATVEIDGAKALERARTDQFDIILLDLMVPNMTGMDILGHLRGTDSPRIHSKIIITTNLEQEESKREAIEHQADGYLIKANVTPKELVDFLQNIA